MFDSLLVKKFLCGLQYSTPAIPRPKGLFTLMQIREISQLCQYFESSLTYQAAYFLAFYGLFYISNLAPLFSKQLDKNCHLLRSDVVFAYPGVHIKVKWT